MISARTRLAGVIGDPVRHSLSPVQHNAAYRELGLDWVYVAFEVRAGAAVPALAGLRALGIVGCSVTMPHKTAVAEACDELSPVAAALRSANTVTVVGDRLVGDSTDGPGFLAALADAGVESAGRSVLICGAGGAARAVADALGRSGARVRVSARRPEAAAVAAGLAGGDTVPWSDRDRAASEVDIVVNATPLGMGADAGLVVAADAFGPDRVVVDLVYHPLETALLAAARERGATAVDGLGMLVHQAARQVRSWTGHEPPIAAMRAAAHAALTEREHA
ncbi:MAG: shikimate dehydrogenase [Actinomycetota bacterium]